MVRLERDNRCAVVAGWMSFRSQALLCRLDSGSVSDEVNGHVGVCRGDQVDRFLVGMVSFSIGADEDAAWVDEFEEGRRDVLDAAVVRQLEEVDVDSFGSTLLTQPCQ